MGQWYEQVTIEKLPVYGAFQNIEASVIAMLFNLLLLMIVESQRIRQRQGRNTLSGVLLAVLLCNVATCTYVFLAYADIGVSNTAICVLQSVALMCNTAVSYLFSAYVLLFINRTLRENEKMPIANRLLVLLEALLLGAWLFFALPYIRRNGVLVRPRGLFYVVTAFLIEAWFMFYAMILIMRRRSLLSERARTTVLATFLLTIATVMLQAVIGRAPVINYLGATFGMFVFYFNVETPDYISLTKALKELEEEKKKSDAASEAKSTFLANMSHEIRTPLSAVLGMNEIIIRESREPAIRSYAAQAERAGQNLLLLINDVLDFSKAESGRLEITEEPYSLTDVLCDVYSIISYRAAEKGLAFRTEAEETTADALCGDALRIRQILLNLLGNSVKYTREGSVRLYVSSNGIVQEDGGDTTELIIRVSDTGIGIAKEDMDKLFNKFERLNMERNSSIEGTGLGLALVKELCEQMGGRIEVKSAYGEGTMIAVHLKQRVLSGERIGNFSERLLPAGEESSVSGPSFLAPDARVLVADDTEINLLLFRKLLEGSGIRIDTAKGGMEAIALTQDIPYDVIFLDQRMPEMDGVRTLSHIRNQEGGRNKETPVVCLTADAVKGARERYLSQGFTDYLTKPFRTQGLEKMLAAYLPSEKMLPAGEEAKAAPRADASDAAREGARDAGAGPDERIMRRWYDRSGLLSFRSAIANCADSETLLEIIKEYVRVVPENKALLVQYLSEGALQDYTVKVHAIKSASRMIGAPDLAEMAYALEKKAEVGRTDEIEKETQELLDAYEEVSRALETVILRAEEGR